MAALLNAVGATLVLLVLRDVFHTLWHPTRHGGLSKLLVTGMWRLSGLAATRRRAAGLAGPLAMVAVVVAWALAMVLGWALVYWPHMPGSFGYATGLDPADHAGFGDALYVSMVNISTLGLGDIAPTSGVLRVFAPLEALLGFALLSATVAWTLGVYPALARRRALGLRLSHLARVHPLTAPDPLTVQPAVLEDLAAEVSVVTVDFMQYAESYYFYDGDDRTSLARRIGYAQRLADRAAGAGRPDTRAAGEVLAAALADLADTLDARFLHTGGAPGEVFRAFADDHGRHAGPR
ncbi:potassium channel family protein [Streptomyces sp. NPDC003327]